MEMKKVLITGGAGFMGLHLANKLADDHYEITILDHFNSQVHGDNRILPQDTRRKVSLITGDVTDAGTFRGALEGQECVIHLAAETGTGQSMYNMERYTKTNIGGTSILCDFLVNHKHNIRKIIVASSRAVYGEGKYLCERCGIVYPEQRTLSSIRTGIYDPSCPVCGESVGLSAVATDENSKVHPSSIYGITKQVQEQMVLMAARMTGIDAYALRYQNVYGPGQSLRNPYTGILSIFSGLAKKDADIYIFEDGQESRDFVFIDDAVRATTECLKTDLRGQFAFNVGSSVRVSILEAAEEIVKFFNSKSKIIINGIFREGDIRHSCADLTHIDAMLGYKPAMRFSDGLYIFLKWIAAQQENSIIDSYFAALRKIREKGSCGKQQQCPDTQ